jgi:cell division protein FtsZ
MQELGRHVNEDTQILFGTVVDGRLGDRLNVTIISSLAADDDFVSQPRNAGTLSSASVQSPDREHYEPAPETNGEPEPVAMEPLPVEESIAFEEPVAAEEVSTESFAPSEPEPVVVPAKKKPIAQPEEKLPPEKSLPAKQEVLQFEPVTRGRFEKSEPTIVEGEDLDVPTYLRKNIKVK